MLAIESYLRHWTHGSCLYRICLLLYFAVNASPYPAAPSGAQTDGRPRLKPFHFDANLIDGKSVRVFCQLAEGTVPVSFQWLKDNIPLISPLSQSSSSSSSNSASAADSTHISIVTYPDYSSLAINRIDRRRDNGNYTCIAANSYGTDQFGSLLNVQEPPTFEEKPTAVSIGIGQSRVIKCRASTSYTIPEIRWNRILTGFNLAGLAIGKDARREHIATGEQLHLTDVREQDAGVYECVADPHNDLVISHTFTVTVNVPPSFDSKTDMLEVKRGETAKLVCEVHGAKPVTIKWLRQNVRNGRFDEINLDIVPESFTFPRYTALEKNFDSNIVASLGNAAAVSTNRKLSSHSDEATNLHFVNNNRTLFELHINAVNSADNGQYECEASNAFGEDRRRISLFVQDVPSAVREVHINTIWSRDVLITWFTPEAIGNSPIVQYVVQYWKEVRAPNQSQSSGGGSGVGGGGHRLHEIETSPSETQATIKNLIPGTAYVIRVIAVNAYGRGAAAAPVRVITQEEMPDAAPIDIAAEPIGTTALRVRWKAPPRSHWNGQLQGYYLGYRLLGSSAIVDANDRNDGAPGAVDINSNEIVQTSYGYKQIPFNGLPSENFQEEFQLVGLNRASLYSIIIRAFNGAGEGPNSQEIIVSTAANDPPPKPLLWSMKTKENSVLLQWDQKASTTEITHYVFYFKEEKKINWLEMMYTPNVDSSDEQSGGSGVSTSANTFELNGLHRGTVYQIYMRSVGEKSAFSEPSDMITVRTEGEVAAINLDSSAQTYPVVAAMPTVYSPASHSHYLQPPSQTYPYGNNYSQSSSSQQQQVPPYLRVAFVVPVIIAAVIVVIACVSAYVYIRVDDRKAKMRAYKSAAAVAATMPNGIYAGTVAVPPGKRFQYISTGGGGANQSSSGFGSSISAHNSTASFNLGHSQQSGKHDLSTQSLVSEEGSLSFRYSDTSSDKCRPLLAASRPPPQPTIPTGVLWAQQQSPIVEEEEEAIVEIDSSAYETLPFQKNGGMVTSTPMSSFNQGHVAGTKMNTTNSNHSTNSNNSSRSPAFPPPPPPLPGAFVGHPTKSPMGNGKNNNPPSNVFCHVDVHHVQSSGASDANNSDSYDEFHFFTPGPQHV